MSDADQAEWMQYIYMQKPMPTNATGVPVNIFATNANGQTEQIATVTSESNGMFYYAWKPSATGTYTINAVFDGSNSYWGSNDATAVAVDTAAVVTPVPTETPTATETPIATPTVTPTAVPQPDSGVSTETLLIASAAIIIVVAVIAAALVLRKRK